MKSLKWPNFEDCLPYWEHACTVREKTTQLWFSKTHLNFPLDLLFDRRRPNPLGDCSEAVRNHRESTFSSGCYYGNAANRKNNGQRKKILIIPLRGLKRQHLAWGQEMEGKLNDKINQRCLLPAMCLKGQNAVCAAQGFPQVTYLVLIFSSLLQFSFKSCNSHNSTSVSFFFFFGQ